MAWNDDPQPVLTTARLRLRPMTPADGPRVEVLAGDRAIADTTAGVPHPYPAGGGAEWISTHPARWRTGSEIVFGLALPATDEIGLGLTAVLCLWHVLHLRLARERYLLPHLMRRKSCAMPGSLALFAPSGALPLRTCATPPPRALA